MEASAGGGVSAGGGGRESRAWFQWQEPGCGSILGLFKAAGPFGATTNPSSRWSTCQSMLRLTPASMGGQVIRQETLLHLQLGTVPFQAADSKWAWPILSSKRRPRKQ